jgi:hypothetical protein
MSSSKTGTKIPELSPLIKKYGCGLGSRPKYVIVGEFYSEEGNFVARGILAASTNEFHAHILRREISKNGQADVYQTEFHPEGMTFSISAYRKALRANKVQESDNT